MPSHDQPRDRLAGLEPQLGRDDLRPEAGIREDALDVAARVAVAAVRAELVPAVCAGELLDREDEHAAGTERAAAAAATASSGPK